MMVEKVIHEVAVSTQLRPSILNFELSGGTEQHGSKISTVPV